MKAVFFYILAAGMLVFPLITPAPSAYAVTCSGSGCNGKDPIYTGCNQNSYLAKRYIIPDQNGLAMWQTFADIYYSRSCGTNWVRVTQNPFGGITYKAIWTSSYFEEEVDYGYGSSYSMQVYAPGSTQIKFYVKFFSSSKTPLAYTGIITLK